MLAEAAGTSVRSDILAALKQASAATGSDFNYLLCTAMRESSLRPLAKSATSSACGLFQFVEQTWFGLVKEFGAKYGLGSFADAIERNTDGHFGADNAGDRRAILALRNNPAISALMAGEYANVTRVSLEGALGRTVSNGELYAAHFLGPEAACRLIRMNQSQPQACAATAFPQAADANRNVFYHADGTAKSVHEVYGWAVKQPVAAQAAAVSEVISQSGVPHSVQPDAGPEDWTAMRLWAATQPASATSLSSTLWPQAPLAATPDVLDILGSFNDPSSPKLRKSE